MDGAAAFDGVAEGIVDGLRSGRHGQRRTRTLPHFATEQRANDGSTMDDGRRIWPPEPLELRVFLLLLLFSVYSPFGDR
jgi:hypothetical protein